MNDTVNLSYNIDDFIIHGGKTFPFSEPEPDEFCWVCPHELGAGTFQRVKIKPGFDLWLSDCTFYRDVVFDECKTPALIQFNFTLSGHYHVRFKDLKNPVIYCGEYQAIGSYNDLNITCRVMNNVPVRYVSLTLDPDAFFSVFEKYLHMVPALIHDVFKENSGSGYLYQSAITPAMREIMQQIIECPFRGITRKLYLESKALELVSLQLHQISDL